MPKALAKSERDAKREAVELFFEAFKSVRGTTSAPASDVARFREAVSACREADIAPWRELRTPLQAAADVVLKADAQIVGDGLSLLWREQLRDMREALGYGEAAPLEKPLIDHACLCWVRLALMEIRYSGVVCASNTNAAVEHIEKRLTQAQKRFDRACETLARVRKLSRVTPKVQINVAAEGGKQVNVV